MGPVTGPAAEVAAAATDDSASHRRLVLIGGLPGAGKTRLLTRLLADDGEALCGLDSEYVAERLRDSGVRLPYRLLRPGVHTWHRLTVRWAIRGPAPLVVVTDPLTSARRRAALIEAGRRAGREVRLVLLAVPPETARRGQELRHRTLGARSMARHDRGWRALLAQTRTDGGVPGADGTVVLDRERAEKLSLAELLAS
jgi:hypothetical protein